MNTEQMRQELLKLYGALWRSKVRKMNSDQIQAIYLRFKKEGKLK
jgi:hypothetical protein